jgi:hypothetical protein
MRHEITGDFIKLLCYIHQIILIGILWNQGKCDELGIKHTWRNNKFTVVLQMSRGRWSSRRKPAPVPLCPPQISHDLTRCEPGPRGGKSATNRLSYGTANNILNFFQPKSYSQNPEMKCRWIIRRINIISLKNNACSSLFVQKMTKALISIE